MKKRIIYIFLAFLFIVTHCRAQISEKTLGDFRHIIELIKQDKVKELSALIKYPLKRPRPLHDIADAKTFISYYNTMIDAEFRKKIAGYNDSVVMESNGTYGLVGGDFNGDMWINDNGKIVAINYSSVAEQALKKGTTTSMKKRMHPSVNDWEENLLTGKSEKLLVRVDKTSQGIRYVCWSKGHSISDKPDLVLLNGKQEAQGTLGGWTYTFVNGDWTYVVDDVDMCETEDKCGLFLELLFKGGAKSRTRLTKMK